MDGLTIGVIFVGVWLCIALIYCVLKVFAPKLPDLFSCCCDCRLFRDQDEPRDPFNDPGWYPQHMRPQLPMIVIKNGHVSSSSDSSSDEESDGSVERLRERGPDGRKRAGGSLLLTSSNDPTSRRERVLVA